MHHPLLNPDYTSERNTTTVVRCGRAFVFHKLISAVYAHKLEKRGCLIYRVPEERYIFHSGILQWKREQMVSGVLPFLVGAKENIGTSPTSEYHQRPSLMKL
eukprot:scaffold13271_cov110-Cylindrotheca_fusiformis.AAC.5